MEEIVKKKKCAQCGEEKESKDFYLRTNGKLQSYCKDCTRENSRVWEKNHPGERLARDHKNGVYRPMTEAKDCSLFLGVIVAEKVLSKFFDNITRMPHGNPKFDYICGRGFKIDVKSACLFYSERQSPHWNFHIGKNEITDYFLCLGFDSRENLEPQHVWLIPGKEINTKISITISKTQKSLDRWSSYEKPLDKVIACCNQMRG